MGWQRGLLLLAAALLAAVLGLVASVAINGPGLLLASAPGRWLFEQLSTAPGAAVPIAHGQPVPAFRLPDLQDRVHALPPRGRPVILNYWASWCQPCRQEMPLLSAQARRPGSPVVVGIALDEPGPAGAFLAGTPVGFLVLVESPGPRDSSVVLGNRRGVLPYSVLIDAQGRLVRQKVGAFRDAAELAAWAGTAPDR